MVRRFPPNGCGARGSTAGGRGFAPNRGAPSRDPSGARGPAAGGRGFAPNRGADGYEGNAEDDGAPECVGERLAHSVTALRGLELRRIEVCFFERLREATSYEVVT